MPKILSLLALLATVLIASSALANDDAGYTYDAQGRLVSTTYTNGTVINYSYDNAGNRTQTSVSCQGSTC